MKQPYTPERLPIKSLDFESFIPRLGEAREQIARYDEAIRPLPPSILDVMKWEESISSLQSQNIEADVKEVLRFALDKTADEARAPLLQKILNAKDGLNFAIQWPHALNLSFLCRIHAFVKKDGPNPKEIGRLRKRQNWIGAEGCPIEEAYFLPPKFHLLPALIKNWCLYSYRKDLDPLLQLAILIAQFLILHPFMDGNGRVARIYIPIFLARKKLISGPFFFLSRYFERCRLQYMQKLFRISETGDWESWILYFLEGVIEEAIFWKAQAEQLKQLYLSVKRPDLFLQPVRTSRLASLQKKKILIEHPKGLFWFEPLFDAIR